MYHIHQIIVVYPVNDYTLYGKLIYAGEPRVLMLDAKERAAKFSCAAADDTPMRPTVEDFHSRAAHEEGRL